MVLDYTSKILQIARIKPLLPSDVSQALSTNSLLASSMLSEMVSSGKLKVSFLKIGSSPLYYIHENVGMLESFTSHLNEKDQNTCQLLKNSGVLQDSDLDPLTRVSLRQIKDFAKPLEVTVNGESQIFWKWFLLADQETEDKVKKILAIEEQASKSTPVSPQVPPVQPVQPVPPQPVSPAIQPSPEVFPQPKPIASTQISTPKPEIKSEIEKFVDKKESAKKDDKKDQKELKFTPPVSSEEKKEVKELSKKEETPDPLLLELLKFFNTNQVVILENAVIKKNAEVDLILEFNSLFGRLSYYCKAKKKKKVSASDLYSAFVQGQLKKLPIIFLTNGELTKQATEAIKDLKGITYKQISLPQ